MLTVQILGPTRVWREGIEVGLGPARRRALFGLLALAAGQPRARHELIDALWIQRLHGPGRREQRRR